MKKPLMLLLILSVTVLLLSAASAGAPLAEPSGMTSYWNDGIWELGPEYKDIRWTDSEVGPLHGYVLLDDGTAELVDMTYYGSWIPDTVDDIPVTAIGLLGISDRLDYPMDLTIPAGVTRISEDVLRYAPKNLFTRVDPANPYFSVENGMLFDLQSRRLIAFLQEGPCTLPADTLRIGCKAFAECTFDSIALPDGLTGIGSFAFAGCSALSSVTIPDSVTDIGFNPFTNCTSLQEIVISPNHPVYGFRDGILYRKADMQAVSVLPYGTDGAWSLPDWVQSVGPYAFAEDENLREVSLHDGLREIPEGAFMNCYNLVSVRIPEGIGSIGPGAFSGCAVNEIDIPESVAEIGLIAFANCIELKNVRFSEGLTAIHPCAFSRCDNLRSVSLPRGLLTIGDNAFCFCDSLNEIVIPDTVSSIGEDAFYGCEENLSVAVSPGSCAEQYCIDHDIAYVYAD